VGEGESETERERDKWRRMGWVISCQSRQAQRVSLCRRRLLSATEQTVVALGVKVDKRGSVKSQKMSFFLWDSH
jgi:hypothetical protein